MKLIEIRDAVPRIDNLRFKQPINWSIYQGQHWALIGPNGAGKTLVIDILTGKHGLKSGYISSTDNQSISSTVKHLSFSDIYDLADIKNSYYQQRWNSGDEKEMPTVKALFNHGEKAWIDFLVNSFRIEELIPKQVNLLSSGELRKVLIVRSLLSKPRILILDNPFIGLDAMSRLFLNQVLEKMSIFDDLQIVLVLSDPRDIPSIITHVLPIKDKELWTEMSSKEFLSDKNIQRQLFETNSLNATEDSLNQEINNYPFQKVFVLKNINIRYGKRTILKDLNWQVKRGEKWALLGENGSGKSTLLSLVLGDNPQAYANNITLFDRKRGTGESIWDIKKHIGYISPEMHLYYLKNVRCIDVVGSGFFDTIGLYRKCNMEQMSLALRWMTLFGIENIKDTSFLNISTGEQRLVLLARIFVKNPDVLILDEPLHGLDVANKQRIKKIIEKFANVNKTLIYVTHYGEEIPDIVTHRLTLTKHS